MLYKHHLKEFDSWLENSLMTDSDKIAFDQWIKNSPNPIYLPEIPPVNGSFRDPNGYLWCAYLIKIRVEIDNDAWEKNSNKKYSSIQNKEIIAFHNWFLSCPLRTCGIDERKTGYSYPRYDFKKRRWVGRRQSLLYLTVSTIKTNSIYFENLRDQSVDQRYKEYSY